MGVRLKRDVKPVDVARELGVSQATVSDWEGGVSKPRDEFMIPLAAFLGVTPAYLRYGEQYAPTMDRGKTITEVLAEGQAKAPRRKTRGQ